MKRLKALIRLAGTRGLYVPHAFDGRDKKPSIRLLFAVISFCMACCSLAALHVSDGFLVPSIATVTFFVICTVFYMLRDLDKAKINLKEQSFELEDTHDNEK